VEDAHDGDLAGGSERPLDHLVDDDIGELWNHQLTCPPDSTRAAAPRLLGEGSNCAHESPLNPLGRYRVATGNVIQDLE
jgi:hypothetical protein